MNWKPLNSDSRSKIYKIGLEILTVVALLCILQLLDKNVYRANEIDIFPAAKQYVASNWILGDWYLNQPPSYRLLFQIVVGQMIVAWGFLITSIVGRILCYCLIALGLILIKRKLGLSLPLLLLAIFAFMTCQNFAAGELIVSGIQPKVLSYGFVLIALSFMLKRSYYWMALMLGLATSFHVLAGGWSFLIIIGLLILRWNAHKMNVGTLGTIFLIYLITSSFSVKSVLDQLLIPASEGSIPASLVYVFVRLPHHLNPLSWSWDWWVRLIVYLAVLFISIKLLKRVFQSSDENKNFTSEQYIACVRLSEFTLISLVLFMLGVAIAPFNSSGSILQYHIFRVGGVMLPLNTCLLFACALEHSFGSKKRKLVLLGSILLLSLLLIKPIKTFKAQLFSLNEFPSRPQQVFPEQKSLYSWVKNHTPQNTIVITPPGTFDSFTWIAERPTIAKYKLIPQNKLGIPEWYERMRDLSGNNTSILPVFSKDKEFKINKAGFDLPKLLDSEYYSLTTAQVNFLLTKYQAEYFVASVKQELDLSIVYRNSKYIIYHKTEK
ncbi:MAG: hypothetical protein KME21_11575 [Desmonostoc vinosum HA7617-LM4]|nr:hypothetical protein [Desmonostoc vinosum HA7617-LM4]